MKSLKKIFAIMGMGCFLVSGNGYAGPFVKLGRGLTNIVTSPAEIIYEPLELKQNNNAWVSWLGGVPKGVVYFPFRAAVGVYDALTFLIPYPKKFAPLIKPETLVEGFESL